jgi:hypothetical protein
VPERGWRAYAGVMNALATRTPAALAEFLAGRDDTHRWFEQIAAQVRAVDFDEDAAFLNRIIAEFLRG